MIIGRLPSLISLFPVMSDIKSLHPPSYQYQQRGSRTVLDRWSIYCKRRKDEVSHNDGDMLVDCEEQLVIDNEESEDASPLESFATSTKGFATELKKTNFHIFRPIQSLGYFSWSWRSRSPNNPKIIMGSDDTNQYQYNKSLEDISSAEEILCHIDFDGKPDALIKPELLKTPTQFEKNPVDNKFKNRFPFGQMDVAGLHVAAQRGVGFNEVDFAFGGSILEMLANANTSGPCVATRIPGTTCIMVTKAKEYIINLADIGYQFERYVTGSSMSDTSLVSHRYVEHLHLAKVGEHTVLFRAEVDAGIDCCDSTGEMAPVEVKASNPKYFGTKIMFQMISSGSTSFCHGKKSGGTLTGVTIKPLSQVSSDAFVQEGSLKIEQLEQNILDNMEILKDGIKGYELYEIQFINGVLKLSPALNKINNKLVILPKADIVKDLICCKNSQS